MKDAYLDLSDDGQLRVVDLMERNEATCTCLRQDGTHARDCDWVLEFQAAVATVAAEEEEK